MKLPVFWRYPSAKCLPSADQELGLATSLLSVQPRNSRERTKKNVEEEGACLLVWRRGRLRAWDLLPAERPGARSSATAGDAGNQERRLWNRKARASSWEDIFFPSREPEPASQRFEKQSYCVGEKYEPCNIKQNRTDEKYPAKALATALNRNKCKECDHQVDQQHTIKPCTEGSDQSTANLDVDEDNSQRLDPIVVPKP